jgi:hypothetical protein
MGYICELLEPPPQNTLPKFSTRPASSRAGKSKPSRVSSSRWQSDLDIEASSPPGLFSLPQSKLKNRKSKIASSTPIVPSAIAIALWEEASQWLGEPLPRSWMFVLIRRAEAIYDHNPAFRARIHRHGNSGRDYLWTFMRHWLAGLIIKHRPDLAAKLPASYKVGQSLQ